MVMDWIQGERFIGLGNYTYAPATREVGDYDGLQNTLNISLLKDGDIIYTHTIYAKKLLDLIRNIEQKVILVTHNGDVNIDDTFVIPNCVIKWYTQNVQQTDQRLQSLPIGLENSRWFRGLKKRERMAGLLSKPKDIRNMVYMNHNINTNPSARYAPYYYFEGKSWVTTKHGKNGENFEEYLENIYNHPFVVCPEGNGADTHRVWETLYMGSIPIQRSDLNNKFYTDLPIYFVDRWADVNEKTLQQAYNRIRSMDWNLDKLTFNYWKTKIQHTWKYEDQLSL